MKYIITGGAGFIGSHLAEKLLKDNDVIIVDDLSSGYLENIKHLKTVIILEKKIQDCHLDEILGNIDGIFHLAAQTSVPRSIDEFYSSSSNNLLSTIKIFDLAQKNGIPVVYASSSAIYGNLMEGDDRSNKYDILSPYAQDKLTMEHYAKMAHDVYGIPSVGFRFFNVYGPRQDPSSLYSGVISIFVDRILKQQPVQINGGYQTRDFVYVKDVCEVMIKAMTKLQNDSFCSVLNVGTGISCTIDDLLLTIQQIMNATPEVIRKNLPKGDPERSSGNYEKLEKFLQTDLSPFIALNEGLRETISYIIKAKV